MKTPIYNIRNLTTGFLIAWGLLGHEAAAFITRNPELRLGLETIYI